MHSAPSAWARPTHVDRPPAVDTCAPIGISIAALDAKLRRTPMAYFINDKCVGCTACETVCPVTAITGVKKEFYFIDPKVCIDCGACGRACPYDAILDSFGSLAEKVRRTEWPKPVILA